MGWHRRTSSTNSADQLISRLVSITDCPPNLTLHRRRSSLPGRRCSHLEQSATARHFCAFSSRLCISAENPLFSVSFLEQFWIRHSDWSSYLLSVCACLFLYYYAVFFTSLLLLGFDVIKMKSEWLLCVSAMSVATMCWTTTHQMISRLYAATLSPLRHKDNWRLPALTVETDSCCVHVP